MTMSRVLAPTTRLPDRTWETVVGLTPARTATSAIVTRPEAAGRVDSSVGMAGTVLGQNDLSPWEPRVTDLVERYRVESLLSPDLGARVMTPALGRVDVHWHDYYELSLVVEGEAVHVVNG